MRKILPNWLIYDEVVRQVNDEYDFSYNKIRTKRDMLSARYKLYSNISDIDDRKIYSRMIYSIAQMIISINLMDKKLVKFIGRNLWDDEIGSNIESLADFDFEEMWLDELKEQRLFDWLIMWVWIYMSDGFDYIRTVPRIKVVEPTAWIPDAAYDVNYWHRYQWFETEVTKDQLINDWTYFDVNWIKPTDIAKVEAFIEEQMSQGKSMDQLMNTNIVKWSRYLTYNSTDTVDNSVYTVYEHFTIIKWVKYRVTMANERWLIIRCNEIKPVRKEEKKNKSLVPYPIVSENFSRLRHDPFGISLCDLLEDKQRGKQLFLNLNRLMAEANARWEPMFVDNSIDINKLTKRSAARKYISFDMKKLWWQPAFTLERTPVSNDAYQMPNILEQEWFQDVWYDEASLWVAWDTSKTATENVRVQGNSNLRALLNSKRVIRAEKKLRDILWYRVYQEFMPSSSKKYAMVTSWFWQSPVSFKRDDFITLNNLDVRIVSESEDNKRLEEQRNMIVPNLSMLMSISSDQSDYAKKYVARMAYRSLWFTHEESVFATGVSEDEKKAKNFKELLLRWEDVPPIRDLSEDHDTYIAVYSSVPSNPARDRAIEARYRAKSVVWKQPEQPPQQNQSAANQMTANEVSKDRVQSVPTLADVTNG